MIADCFFNAAKSIFRKKGKNILTVLGVGIGVMSVIIVGNIGSTGTLAVSREFDSLGLNGITISSNDKSSTVTSEELDIIKCSETVASATPIVVATGSANIKGKDSNVIVWGIDSNASEIVSLDIMYGRFIDLSDVKNTSKVCMVDKEFARNMYGRDNIVGKNITVSVNSSQDVYTVVGIIKTGSGLLQTAMGSYIPNFIYMPYSTLQVDIGMSGFHQIAVKTNEHYSVDFAGKMLVERLNKASGKDDGYVSQNLAKQKEVLMNIMSIVTVILSIIGGISFIVAGLNIMTVMLVSVSERRKEIGIKKAIGASNAAIMTEFLFESIIICVLGAVSGIMLGYLITFTGSIIIGQNYSINYRIMVYAMIISMAAGIVFGVYPAKKAAALDPVKSLRYE